MSTCRIACGNTPPGATGWMAYTGNTPGIYVDVNTSSGKFTSAPIYTTSLGGINAHWATTGATSIYYPTATGFRVYVRWSDAASLTPATANANQWHINWIGMEV